MRKIIIIAGPNGAGKTSFAREFLPNEAGCPEFLNADLIAAGLSPFRPESVSFAAGRLMLQRLSELEEMRSSFGFETTLATRIYLGRILRWRAMGYRIKLYFLELPDAEFAIRRVAFRVKQGGHFIPEDVIRRRFARGLENLKREYLRAVDEWSIYDASGRTVRLISAGDNRPPPNIMEETPDYQTSSRPETAVQPLDDPDYIGAEAAFNRATAKAIAQAEAAGLEPVVRSEEEPRIDAKARED